MGPPPGADRLPDALIEPDDERSSAHTNCHGLPAELLGENLAALLTSDEGRRAAKEAALHVLLGNATDTRAASILYLQVVACEVKLARAHACA